MGQPGGDNVVVQSLNLFGHIYAATELPQVIEYDPVTLETLGKVDVSSRIPGIRLMTPHPMYDNDDIFRYIDEESDVECADEITRLKRKRKGFRAAFTGILNIIDRLITASRGADNRINRSEDNRLAIQKAFEKLEQRFDKMEKVNHRILTINRVQDDDAGYQEAIKTAENQ